jgi:hypothetical protein
VGIENPEEWHRNIFRIPLLLAWSFHKYCWPKSNAAASIEKMMVPMPGIGGDVCRSRVPLMKLQILFTSLEMSRRLLQ